MTRETIRIDGLRVMTVVGVHDWERRAPREVVIDMVLEADLGAARRSDNLDDTVDYDAVARLVEERVRPLHAKLIERIADEAVWACFGADPRIESVCVTVHKPGAVQGADDVSITVRQVRRDA